MKLFIMKYLLRTLCIISPLAMLSCMRDGTSFRTETGDSEEVPMNISVQLPATRTNSTVTTPGTEQENYIKSLHVLSFRVDENDPSLEYYDYKTVATLLSSDSDASNIRNFRVRALRKDHKQRFVLITNAGDVVSTITDSDKDTPKEDLLERLVFEKGDHWHATGASDFVYIPMWGESEQVLVGQSDLVLPTIKVIRMVSRLDVLTATQEAADVFKLTSVHLYNYHNNGRVTPDRDPANWDDSEKKALSPSLPISGSLRDRGPRKYDAISASGISTIPSIYTFETPAADYGDADEATCVVIGGKYADDTQPTYYRVDFFREDDSGSITGYKHLLRNHLYRVNIVSVEGSGYEDPEKAFRGKSLNMTVEVKEWDEGDITNVVFDGQYMLGVSQDVFTLSRRYSNNNLLIVTTDHPDGWKVEVVGDDSDWLKVVSRTDKGADQKDDLIFSVEENSGGERVAYLKISAGRLSLLVKVVQLDADQLSIEITSGGLPVDELCFLCHYEEGDVPAQEFTVAWTPTDIEAHVSTVPLTNVAFASGTADCPEDDTSISNGTKTYNIKPRAFTTADIHPQTGDPFLDKKSRYNFVVSDNGQTLARSIELRQIRYDLLASPEESYMADGSEYHYTIKTNADWTAEITTNPGNIITKWDMAGQKNKDGKEFYFTVKDASLPSQVTAVVTYTLTGEKGEIITRTVNLLIGPQREAFDAKGSNCYMLKPGGDGVKIPVAWANSGEFTNRIGTSTDLRAKLIWTDSKEGMSAKGVVSNINLDGNGAAAKLEVYPGESVGNALVGVYAAGNEKIILWSWHIWVSDYVPGSSNTYTHKTLTWMDRNLGATTSQRGSNASLGLHYQWGRKDPFPGITASGGTTEVPLYDAEGKPFSIDYNVVQVSSNVENGVSYPTRYYFSAGNNNGTWITTSTNTTGDAVRNDLWGNGAAKTIFDPCPEGWRVPSGECFTKDGNINFNSSNKDVYWLAYYPADLLTGYFPLAGNRDSGSGSINTSGYNGYWSALNHGAYGRALRVIHTGGTIANSGATEYFGRAAGASVRCVKE